MLLQKLTLWLEKKSVQVLKMSLLTEVSLSSVSLASKLLKMLLIFIFDTI